MPMLAEELFHLLEKEASWRVECTFIEIYNERVRACLSLAAHTSGRSRVGCERGARCCGDGL